MDLAAARYDFFKSRLPDYDSPDPRVAKQQPQQPTEPKKTAVDAASNFDSPEPRGAVAVQPEVDFAANRQDLDKSTDPKPKADTQHQQQQPTESQQTADDDASNFLNINTENDEPEVSASSTGEVSAGSTGTEHDDLEVSAGSAHTENDESVASNDSTASNESDPSNVTDQSNVTNHSNDFNQSMTVPDQSD